MGIEFAKMRRLKVWPVSIVISLGTLLFSGMRLFSSGYAATINDPGEFHWEQTLLFYAISKAMTAPILVAVLASRQVEMEHVGNGWTMAATLGQSRARLCLVKLFALAPLVGFATIFELGGLVIGSRAVGCTLPLPVWPWVWYALASYLVTMVLLGLHIWLSARFEQQLIGLGIGVLGAFAGVFAMLMPAWLARMLPWGHYAVTSPYAMSPEGVERLPIEWLPTSLLLALGVGLLTLGFHKLNQEN